MDEGCHFMMIFYFSINFDAVCSNFNLKNRLSLSLAYIVELFSRKVFFYRLNKAHQLTF